MGGSGVERIVKGGQRSCCWIHIFCCGRPASLAGCQLRPVAC
jgi:hypothetical protein